METTETLVYAGFWWRVLASAIDQILITIALIPILLIVYGGVNFDLSAIDQGAIDQRAIDQGLGDLLLSVLVPAIIVLVFWAARSATPGKMVISARIVCADTGERPTTGQFVIRYLGYYLSLLPLALGFVWIAVDPRKQGWHDKLAGTVVVRKVTSGQPVRFEARG